MDTDYLVEEYTQKLKSESKYTEEQIELLVKGFVDGLQSCKEQIQGYERDFDYQNKVIDKYKEQLKQLRLAFIQAQVSILSGSLSSTFENIFGD